MRLLGLGGMGRSEDGEVAAQSFFFFFLFSSKSKYNPLHVLPLLALTTIHFSPLTPRPYSAGQPLSFVRAEKLSHKHCDRVRSCLRVYAPWL